MDLLIDSRNGIYIPQLFAQIYGHHATAETQRQDIELLKQGPDHPEYWEAWEDVLDKFTIQDDGKTYHLIQNEDLFAYEDGEDISSVFE